MTLISHFRHLNLHRTINLNSLKKKRGLKDWVAGELEHTLCNCMLQDYSLNSSTVIHFQSFIKRYLKLSHNIYNRLAANTLYCQHTQKIQNVC